MSMYRELRFDADVENITAVQFGILGPEEIVARSVVEILTNETYAGQDAVPNGLLDPRMGVIDNNGRCVTCEQKNTMCPGHFGHITLAKPVFYAQFVDYVRKILRCVCHRCSKLMMVDSPDASFAVSNKKIPRAKRFDAVYKSCTTYKRKTCAGCGARRPDRFTKDSILRIIMEWKREKNPAGESSSSAAASSASASSATNPTRKVLSAEDALKILKKITDEDAEILGFSTKLSRPEWLICSVLPVPPPAARPSVRNDTGQRMEDDLTHKLSDIIKVNDALRNKIVKGATKEQIEGQVHLLQFHVATLVDNNIPGLGPTVQRTGRPLRSLYERLKCKDGRIRGNLMGKRVDFSARTVITPDPNISIDEVGVPLRIAMNLTFPEIVSASTRAHLTDLVRRGPNAWPGAKYVRKLRPVYHVIRLKNIDPSEIVLEDGDFVDRHLIDGDFVLFNRQPSLHRMSMMGHRVRVMAYGDTFRLNVCVTSGYNADYDGDEMNLHVPQSLQTRNELALLAAVPTQIVSPKDSKPIVGIVQDIALGVYRLTKSGVSVTQKQLFNILAANPRFDGVYPAAGGPDGRWTGRQLLSRNLPRLVNFSGENKSFDEEKEGGDDENYVKIVCGEVIQGRVDKKVYQDRSKGLVHAIYNDLGAEETRVFLDNTQSLICNWLILDGFSVGISDLVADETTRAEMQGVIKEMKSQVDEIITRVHTGRFINESRQSTHDKFENDVIRILNSAVDKAGKIGLQKIDDASNRMINMVKSGSKGSTLNVSQMIACLGQQNVSGARIAYGFEHRTLPHYHRFDDGPESRGFVSSSFIGGLTPQEFFFHSMGGREGLIDTAVRTSATGYIQRKLVKAMEDLKCSHDGSVRSANGAIIQFLYGEDGIDAIKLESQPIFYVDKSYIQLEDAFLISAKEDMGYLLDKETRRAFHGTHDWTRRCADHFRQLVDDREHYIRSICGGQMEKSVFCPVPFTRILNNINATMKKAGVDNVLSDLNPLYVLDTIDELCCDLVVNPTFPKAGNALFKMLIRMHLSPKQLLTRYGLDTKTFDHVVRTVRRRFLDAIVNASEMVGVIAAQSIGEPLSQLTLNSFHVSGSAAATKATRGVPRIEELTRVTRNLKSPSMTIFLSRDQGGNKERAIELKNRIALTTFKDVVKASKIYFEPNDLKTTIAQDIKLVDLYNRFSLDRNGSDETTVTSKRSAPATVPAPWLLRLEIDRQQLAEHDLTMLDLKLALDTHFGVDERMSCIFSDDNASELIFRIRLQQQPIQVQQQAQDDDRSTKTAGIHQLDDTLTDLKAMESAVLNDVIIRGIPDIKGAELLPRNDTLKYDAESGTFLKMGEYILATQGTNLPAILGLAWVDPTRTTSNDITEIYRIFGIEAARQALINEMTDVLRDSGTFISFRHLSLLVDTMTSRGTLMSIDRHGINRMNDIGPLAKCSFEEVNVVLIKAGVFSEIDRVTGISSNVMLGQIAPCGTGDCDVLMDHIALMGTSRDDDKKASVVEDIEEDDEEEDELNVDFGFVVPEKDATIKRKQILV